MLEVKESIKTPLNESHVAPKGCFIQDFFGNRELNCFENGFVIEHFAVFDLRDQSFNIKLRDSYEVVCQILKKLNLFLVLDVALIINPSFYCFK